MEFLGWQGFFFDFSEFRSFKKPLTDRWRHPGKNANSLPYKELNSGTFSMGIRDTGFRELPRQGNRIIN
jgi:hypothetical protein